MSESCRGLGTRVKDPREKEGSHELFESEWRSYRYRYCAQRPKNGNVGGRGKGRVAEQEIEIEVPQNKKQKLDIGEKIVEPSLEKIIYREVNVNNGYGKPYAKSLDLTRGISGKREKEARTKVRRPPPRPPSLPAECMRVPGMEKVELESKKVCREMTPQSLK